MIALDVNAVVFASALGGLAAGLQAFLHTPALMIGAAFIAGMVNSVIWVSILPMLAENTHKEERMHLFSVNFGIGLLAQILGSVAAGGISQVLGSFGFSSVLSIRFTLLVGALLSLAAVVPFSLIKEERKTRARRASEPRQRPLIKLMQLLRDRRNQFNLIARFTVASALIGFGAGLVIPYLNLYFSERFHLSKAMIGLIIGAGQGLTATAMFIGPAAARRFGPVRSVMLFQLTSIPFLLVTGWSMSLGLVAVAVVVRNALMNASNPIQDSIMMALVDDDLKGFAVSAGQTMFTLGWAVMGPVSTGIVHTYGSYTGYAAVFSITAGLYLIGSLFYRWSFGRYESKVCESQQTGLPG